MQVKMMRHRLVRKTFEMIEKIAKDEDTQVLYPFLHISEVMDVYVGEICFYIQEMLRVEGLLFMWVNAWSWQAYPKFWDVFGRNLKLGCTEDPTNHKRIAPLLRFFSSKSEDTLTSLDDYVERMKENQKQIYFLAAESIRSAKNAPFVEELLNRDLEVSDACHTYCITNVLL